MKIVFKIFMLIGGVALLANFLPGAKHAVASDNEGENILLITPSGKDFPFWRQLIEFTEAACEDLGMNLEVYSGDESYRRMVDILERELSGENQPDAVMVPSILGMGENFLAIAEQFQVPILIFNGGVDIDDVGHPRQAYEHWLGQITPDEYQAGYELASRLIEHAIQHKNQDEDEKIVVAGVSGRTSDYSAIQRNEGLQDAIDKFPEAELAQIVATDWSDENARQAFQGLTNRYPDLSVVWTASDRMALTIAEQMEEIGLSANEDIFIGGIDWTIDGLNGVEQGRLLTSAGGHFMEGGWAAVLLHDYFNGHDFADQETVMLSPMNVITREDAGELISLIDRDDWHMIDFTQFSRVQNSSINTYNFSIEHIMSAMQ